MFIPMIELFIHLLADFYFIYLSQSLMDEERSLKYEVDICL